MVNSVFELVVQQLEQWGCPRQGGAAGEPSLSLAGLMVDRIETHIKRALNYLSVKICVMLMFGEHVSGVAHKETTISASVDVLVKNVIEDTKEWLLISTAQPMIPV
ncbi:hypothetical protein J6590_074669 [Homalodisca vitripennis]|nr:hypothetical protein J6590_074669 [Homalodisca vitripennis]